MWGLFFLCALVILLLLYVPGFFLVRFFSHDSLMSLAISPIFSISLYVIAGVLLGLLGIFAEWWMIALPIAVLTIGCFGISHFPRRKEASIYRNSKTGNDWLALALYVVVGVVIVGLFFVRDLNGPDSFAQLYDNASHLNTIRYMVENGNYSILYTSLYSVEEISSGIAPTVSNGSFYPAGWHVVTALGSAISGASAPIAENASLFVFMGIVFPASMALLMLKTFSDRLIVLLGSFIALSFSAFPWGFLTFGPLYSNLAAYAVTPLAVCSVASVFSVDQSKAGRLRWGIAFLAACFAFFALQPNAVFTVIVLAAPLCAANLMESLSLAGVSKRRSGLICASVVLILALAWIVAWRLPFFEGIVTYPWPPFEGRLQALIGALDLSLRAYPSQLLLAGLVLIGAIWSLFKKKYRALTVSYAICIVMFVLCASSDGPLRSLLAGFWYNDAYRIAALVALSSIPLASMGMYVVFRAVVALGAKLKISKPIVCTVGCLVVLFGVCFIYRPSSMIGIGDDEPAFEVVDSKLIWLSAEDVRRYTVEESDFVNNALDLAKDDPGGIVNIPYDGSVFSYGSNGANVMFRSYMTAGASSEKPESVLVREHLDEISDNESVKNAAAALNAKYVLQLDAGGIGASSSSLDDGVADAETYNGITSINEDTPGFSLLASEGDMRFYKIDG